MDLIFCGDVIIKVDLCFFGPLHLAVVWNRKGAGDGMPFVDFFKKTGKFSYLQEP